MMVDKTALERVQERFWKLLEVQIKSLEAATSTPDWIEHGTLEPIKSGVTAPASAQSFWW